MSLKTKAVTIKISPTIGKVSGEYIVPAKPIAIITLAHGAGAGMNHSFMVTLANALAEANVATLRFNFPFTENKKFRPDSPAVAHQTIEEVIVNATKTYPDLPLFAAGKSFGGRMSSQFISANPNPIVKGLIFYGFPLHPTGKPSIERAEHLKAIKIPMLFLQGTKDTLATWDLIESVCKALPKATLIKFENADHSFKAGKENNIENLTKSTVEWIKKKVK
jgi:predicted alpha/beta-hydrolase family hydrolase